MESPADTTYANITIYQSLTQLAQSEHVGGMMWQRRSHVTVASSWNTTWKSLSTTVLSKILLWGVLVSDDIYLTESYGKWAGDSETEAVGSKSADFLWAVLQFWGKNQLFISLAEDFKHFLSFFEDLWNTFNASKLKNLTFAALKRHFLPVAGHKCDLCLTTLHYISNPPNTQLHFNVLG